MSARLRELATELGASSRNLADVFLDIPVHRGAATREPTLRASCFEFSFKQSLLHWAGGPKLVFNWLKEESKREPQNVFLEWPQHGVFQSNGRSAKSYQPKPRPSLLVATTTAPATTPQRRQFHNVVPGRQLPPGCHPSTSSPSSKVRNGQSVSGFVTAKPGLGRLTG